ncbi:MAG: glycogen debranching protein GlgX [bacterium]|nr:glycogen debranching protein GlgX [bacterium]
MTTAGRYTCRRYLVPDNSSSVPAWPGDDYPLGATPRKGGCNFAVFSEVAGFVELCLFDEDGTEHRIRLPEVTNAVHHGFVPGIKPGQAYGYRAHGPWDPAHGSRCNPAKLLLDPYSRAISGEPEWDSSLFGHIQSAPDVLSPSDSAAAMPRSIVVDTRFDWEDDGPPDIALHDTVIYEAHVKGMTMRHPGVPDDLRGTYAGLAAEPIIEHLQSLGITAIELLPIHHFMSEEHLVKLGLSNYWGYNSIGFFAPHGAYSSAGDCGQQVNEFKEMVKALHRGGIEVILDVVYNHTAEGNHLGPTFSYRGLDNASYYRLAESDPSRYVDYTGTGNSINMRHAESLRLMMDSLRYWVSEMHVDGFRFDLASALARELHEVDRLSSFFDLIHQDPIVSRVKLIAEPWDVGEGGYQVGNFPPLWSEWNDKFRDGVRDYWRGWDESLATFAFRFTGSSDLYGSSQRRPTASVNFVTAHDGFSLVDLVSYNQKHNDANGEEGRDGTNNNRSWNSGVEGPTDDPDVQRIRDARVRSMLATLILSQGVPMIVAGDEMGRSQLGNNNAYAQDNEVSWLDWAGADKELLEFVRRLVGIRSRHRAFRRRRWFEDRPLHGADVREIGWYRPDGSMMNAEDWRVSYAKSLAVYLNGSMIPARDPRGEPVIDDSFLVLFNSGGQECQFTVPAGLQRDEWLVELDTSATDRNGHTYRAHDQITAAPWSVLLLRQATTTYADTIMYALENVRYSVRDDSE